MDVPVFSSLLSGIIIHLFLSSSLSFVSCTLSGPSESLKPVGLGKVCTSSNECKLSDLHSICVKTSKYLETGQMTCECEKEYTNHPGIKVCLQVFECSTTFECDPDLECINSSCRKKKKWKRMNELRTWLPIIVPSVTLALAAVLFAVCANRIRRRSANSNWSWLDRSMASEKSGTETPAPQYEHPPSYSSCFPSTPVLHHAHHIMISNANMSHGNMPLSSSISISLSKTTSYGSTSDLTANPNCTSPETSVVTYPSSHHHHHNDHHNDHNGNSSCSGSKAAKEEV